MKQILAALLIVILFIFFNLAARGQNFPFPEKKYSILGPERDKVFEEYGSTGTENPPEEENYFVPLSSETFNEYEINVPTTTAQIEAGSELIDYMASKNFFSYTKEEWNKMRRKKEKGLRPGEEEPVVSTVPVSIRQQLPPGFAVELPYESQLSISGRKLIGSSLKSTIYDQPEEGKRVNSTSFSMEQQLQVRIKGTVGRKVNVNVDFDDTTNDKRDISVVYKGDPDEFIQEAAFGDIVMTLPQTEFVGYSRQLFGIKMDTKYKNLKTKAFFSRTKGLSEVKRFTGNTQFQRVTIPDTSYIPLKYYSLKSGTDGAKIGTVKIYQADLKISNSSNIIITTTTILDSLLLPTSTYSGNFYLLVPGQDYIVDYHSGIVSFRNSLGSNYMLAIDYQKADGTWLRDSGSQPGQPKIIKDQNNTAGITTELKTFYSLGNVKIIRDNGRGNFILQIKDLSNNIPSSIDPGGKPVPIYPPQVGSAINMNADFDNGIVYFDPADSKPFPDDLYTINNHRYNIYCEYRYRIKIISLRPGIVPQSEKVVMDGRVLKNNQDYFIDYDAGLVTFYDVEKITDDTVIDISYDYAPFGSSGGSTLIGLRSELSLTQNVFIGTSFIYDFTSQTQSVPDIRNTPSSLMVAEVDSRLSDIKIPYTPLKMSVSGEYALSVQNPNIMDKAVIESMEGIQQADSVSFFQEAWLPSATPSKVPFYLGDISASRQEIYKRDISSNLENVADEKQQILNIDYNLTRQNELSLVQVISKEGVDYSKKLYIETWIKGDGKGENLGIEYGTFNEDVDNSGTLRTEDKNNSGTLDTGEDTGWQFRNPDAMYSIYGANNGRLDTEDFNANGILDAFDISAFPGPYGPTNGKTITDMNGITHANVDWTGWKLFRIPINIAFPQDWKNIRQMRITVKGTSNQSGTISFGELTIVGNRWESLGTEVTGSSVTISAINTDDPNYVSLAGNYDYQQLYNSTNSSEDLKRKEQSLSISYNISAASATELGAKEIYSGRPYDFSAYRYLKFFVYSKGAVGDVFFIRACGNDSNYYEYSAPITPDWANNWHRIIIRQDGVAGRADHWVSMDPNGIVAVVGTPFLNNINQIKVGVRTTGPKAGEIWVDDIFVTDSFKKEGQARKVNIDLTLPGSKKIGQMTVGGGRKEIERNFQTFSPGIYDRDYLEDNGHFVFGGLNVSGFNLFPISAQLSRIRTIQPSIIQSQNNLVSILDEGRVISYSGSGQTSLKFGNKLPQFGGTYTRAITDTQQIFRLEDRETVSGNMDYTNPLNIFILPSGVSANYSVSNSFYKVYPSTKMVDSDTFLDVQTFNNYLKLTDYHTLEITENWGLKTPFKFGNFWNFLPSYNLSTVKEKNKDFSNELNYPKSLNQNVAANSNFKFTPWLQPNMNYNISTRENYNLSYSTMTPVPTYPSEKKYVERNSIGEVSWNLQAKDLVSSRYIQSLGFASSYRIQDSDSYDNVDKSFSPLGASLDKLWIRGNNFTDALNSGSTNYIFKSYVTKDDVRVAGKCNPLEGFNFSGRSIPLKTLTANFTYTGSQEHSFITGTQKDVYTRVWPDLLIGLGKIEQMLYLEQWLSDSQLNLRHQRKTSETSGIAFSESNSYGGDWRFNFFRKYDLSLAVNTSRNEDFDLTRSLKTNEGESYEWTTQGGRMFGKWRCILRYSNSESWAKNAIGDYTAQLAKNTYTGQVNADMTFPGGLPIPFTKKKLSLTNRLIVTGNIMYSSQSSKLNIQRDNMDNYNIGSNADYEISQNFRFSIGFAYGRTVFRDNPQENFSTIEATSKLNIQF